MESVSEEFTLNSSLRKMQPHYHTSDKMKKYGMTSRAVEKLVRRLHETLREPLAETLPDFIIQHLHLMGRDEALRAIHFPQDARQLEKARVRLKFEELFYVQLNILRYASDQRRKFRGYVFGRVGELFNTFYHEFLPFPLTEAQKRVVREIRTDMGSGRQMNRLLQGEVSRRVSWHRRRYWLSNTCRPSGSSSVSGATARKDLRCRCAWNC